MAEKTDARVVLISTIVTHGDVHKQHMLHLHELAKQRGMRKRLILVAGGKQVTEQLARQCGMDAGFGHDTTGRDVGSFLVRVLRAQETA
jgi:D-ornithine 4,5-aminomutase subunit beta